MKTVCRVTSFVVPTDTSTSQYLVRFAVVLSLTHPLQSSTLANHLQVALFTLGEVVLLREITLPGGAAVKVQALTYEHSTGGGAGSSKQGGCAAIRVAQVSKQWLEQNVAPDCDTLSFYHSTLVQPTTCLQSTRPGIPFCRVWH